MKTFRVAILLCGLAAVLALTAAFVRADVAERGSGASEAALGDGYSQRGIRVTGTGQATKPPNLATVNLGVQVTADSVTDALQQANASLDAVLAVLPLYGVSDADTQTSYFNINPQYRYTPDNERVLAGYQVTNHLRIKTRDMDGIGALITDVVKAGGNATQVNGIDFSIEDTDALVRIAQAAAVSRATAQAEELARLTGVRLGKPVYISQGIGGSPSPRLQYGAEFARDVYEASTPINVGELEVSVTVEALFAIEY